MKERKKDCGPLSNKAEIVVTALYVLLICGDFSTRDPYLYLLFAYNIKNFVNFLWRTLEINVFIDMHKYAVHEEVLCFGCCKH